MGEADEFIAIPHDFIGLLVPAFYAHLLDRLLSLVQGLVDTLHRPNRMCHLVLRRHGQVFFGGLLCVPGC